MIKVKKIKIENNPILWNLDLDLTKDDGSIYDTILFVGENGSGKSTLMDILYQFTTFENLEIAENERREIVIELSESNDGNIQNGVYKISFDLKDWNNVWGWNYYMSHYIVKYQENDYSRHVLADYSHQYENFIKAIFSDVSINFSAKVTNTTDKKIDTEILTSIKSSENIAQDITQTLVDIKVADNADLYDWVISNEGIAPPAEEKDKRTRRFKEAFEKMFSDTKLAYKNVKDLKPIFEKNNQEIEINRLSSGEKQIVFRWGFLLKDKQSISWALVLVDEPEISMHPRWQKKALDFYKNLFRDWSWNQTSQLIITTHSPYVLQSYDSNTDCIVIFSSEGIKKIDSMRAYIWATPSLWVINWHAFNLPTIEFFNELYEYIQKESGCNTQKYLEKYLKNRGIEQDKEYMDYGRIRHCTLRTFIRNKIHHLGVYQWWDYSNDEFIFAIKGMIDFISKRRLWLPQFPLVIPPCFLYSN